MTILATDVKILKSERITDFEDGGGKMTGFEVVDGAVNNLFPDISRLDRTYGRVSLRKAFAAIRSRNVDTYYGAHCIITEPPADDDVSVTMFSTDSYADERNSARDRIESYLTPSVESRFVLFGNHLRGSRVMSMWVADITVPSPDVGSVFALRRLNKVDDDENAILLDIQYERVQRVISRINGNYVVPLSIPPRKVNVDVITMEVSAILHADFPGFPPTDESGSPAKTKLQLTSATDSAQYYGVSRLAAAAPVGALSVTVDDVFANLVPTAQAEVAVIDQPGAANLLVAAAAANSPISQATQFWPGGVDSVSYFPRSIVPGTFTLNNATYDNGRGLYDDGLVRATIDYATGKVTARPATDVGATMTAIPAAPMTQSGYTGQFFITASTRSYNYVFTLSPLPAPGAFYIDYKAQGNWYRLRDDGAGRLAGDLSSYGSGVVDYTSGSVIFTAGVLPDASTSILYGWGSRENLEIFTGQDQTVAYHLSVTSGYNTSLQTGLVPVGGDVSFNMGAGLAPNSVQLNYSAQGAYTDQYGQQVTVPVPVTAYDDGAGNIVDPSLPDPVGTIDYASGDVTMTTDSTIDMRSYGFGPDSFYPREYN